MSSGYKRNTKPKSSAWKYFKKVTESDEKYGNLSLAKYQCIYCDARYAGHATRLTKHLSRGCQKCPKSVTAEFSKLLKNKIGENADGDKSDSKFLNSISLKSENEDISEADWNETGALNRYGDSSNSVKCKLELKTQTAIEELYARAFYCGGLPLNFTENEYWQEFLQCLEPNFKIPPTAKLSNQLLQGECSYIEEIIRKKVSETAVLGLQCSVMQNKKQHFDVNFILHASKPLFHKTVILQSKDEVSYHLENEIMSIMDQFGPKKFLILIANDISVLEATQILDVDCPDMVRFLCGAHALISFINDIFKLETASSLLTYVKMIIQEMNKIVSETSILLKIPNEKCWKSAFIRLKNFRDNEKYLKQIAADHATYTLTPEIRSVILEDSYWIKIKKLIDFLEPVIEWMNNISKDVGISHIVNCFHELTVHIESSSKINLFKTKELKLIKQFLALKRDLTVTPLHLAANILDPKFNGLHLTHGEQILGSEYVHKISNIIYEKDNKSVKEVLCELAKYRCQEGIFSIPYIMKTSSNLSPDVWWKGSCYGLKLSKVAHFILSMPASVIHVERITRLDVNCVNKTNNLNEEQTSRYVYAYKNLRLLRSANSDISMKNHEDEAGDEENKEDPMASDDEITEIEYELSYDEID